MVNLIDLLEILKFSLRRDLFFLMKNDLELLEKSRDYSLKLERLLTGVGFEDKEFLKSEENFKAARKDILDKFNSRIKEIDELINRFNVDNK